MKSYIIGIDLGGTNIPIALVTSGGMIVRQISISTNVSQGPEKVIERIIKAIKEIMNTVGHKSISGIGIGCAGQIDHKRGVVLFSPNLFWKNVHMVKKIKAAFKGLPVLLDNDANVAALGEYMCGAGKGMKNVIFMTWGTGVGGGIIINGRLYLGATGSAGEVGHIIISHDGPKCNCGNLGCLERYVGNKYIVNRAKELIKKEKNTTIHKLVNNDLSKITPLIIKKAAMKGDKLAKQVWEEMGTYMGMGLVSIINLLNPEAVIIGGGIAKAGNLVFSPIKETIKKRALKAASRNVKILRATLSDKAGIIGAAMLVTQHLNSLPKSRKK